VAEVPTRTTGRAPSAQAKPAKTIGRATIAAALTESRGSDSTKTLGRAAHQPGERADGALTRNIVREKIAERLRGGLTPGGLATWARRQYLEIQRGTPAESGQRETLEDALQQLTLSAVPASRLSDQDLVELMAQLGG
jgi:3-dehydroquinate dehydratase-2